MCLHLNNEIIICDDCDDIYCVDCMNLKCDCCEEFKKCANCDTTVNIFGQTICTGCLYSILDGGTVMYCNTCKEYFIEDNECTIYEHEIIKNEKIIVKKIMEDYVQVTKFLKIFYGDDI